MKLVEAMKNLSKLEEKEIELANIIQKDVQVHKLPLLQTLKSAKIDIVGGETMFFDKIIGSITQGKSMIA